MGTDCSQRRIQNPIKFLRWCIFVKVVNGFNYFSKMLHLGCLVGFWICLWFFYLRCHDIDNKACCWERKWRWNSAFVESWILIQLLSLWNLKCLWYSSVINSKIVLILSTYSSSWFHMKIWKQTGFTFSAIIKVNKKNLSRKNYAPL